MEFSAYSFAIACAKFLRAPFAELKAPKLALPLRDALAPVNRSVPEVFSFNEEAETRVMLFLSSII